MKIELTGAKFLTLPELSELAARLDALHDKTIKTIDRLEREIEAQKARVAKHWEGIRALGPADLGRVMAEQASAAIRAIRENGRPELNAILREAGASYGPLVSQRPYWASKAAVLNRQGLGTSRRGVARGERRARPPGRARRARPARDRHRRPRARGGRRQRERPAPRVGADLLDRRVPLADARPRRSREGEAVPADRREPDERHRAGDQDLADGPPGANREGVDGVRAARRGRRHRRGADRDRRGQRQRRELTDSPRASAVRCRDRSSGRPQNEFLQPPGA
jgi:hypothetical protein